MKSNRTIGWLLALVPVAFLAQGCGNGLGSGFLNADSGNDESGQVSQNSGNGGIYGGVRVYAMQPGFKCDGKPSYYAEIEVRGSEYILTKEACVAKSEIVTSQVVPVSPALNPGGAQTLSLNYGGLFFQTQSATTPDDANTYTLALGCGSNTDASNNRYKVDIEFNYAGAARAHLIFYEVPLVPTTFTIHSDRYAALTPRSPANREFDGAGGLEILIGPKGSSPVAGSMNIPSEFNPASIVPYTLECVDYTLGYNPLLPLPPSF